MSDPTETGLSREQHYRQIHDQMISDMEAKREELDNLPVGVRGLAKVFYAILQAVVVPIVAFFSSISANNQEDQEIWRDRPTEKMRVSRDRDWWKEILSAFGYTSQTISALENLIPDNIPGPGIVHFVYVAFFVVSAMNDLRQVISADTYKELMSRYRAGVADPGSVLRAAFVAPELYDSVVRVLRQNGLTDEDIKLLFVAQYATEDIETIRSVYYREAKSPEWLDNRLSEIGFTPERREEVSSTFPIIPGIQDLIMMQAKEAFEPDQIAKFGLGSEAPQDIYEWTRKQGLPDEWTNRYWISHWQHASYAQVMEMLHRGYITLDDVYEWYRLVEIPPYWRDLLTKIAYSPYTRVDVRRMHAAGVIGDDELIQAMKDIGYDQEHAEKMAEFYKRYNAGAAKELSKSDIEKAYEDRDLNYSQAINMLMMIGYDAELANFYLARIDLEMERAQRLERIDLVKDKYLANLYNVDQARNALIGYGVTLERVAELLDRWGVQVVKNAKLPSKTDLDKFVRAKVLDEASYRSEMTKLGYSTYYIDLYWQYLASGGT